MILSFLYKSKYKFVLYVYPKLIYKRIFTLLTGSTALHFMTTRGATDCKAHTNFANELSCLMASNIYNEVVSIHRSQEVLKRPFLYT
jgi:hypothetical protein